MKHQMKYTGQNHAGLSHSKFNYSGLFITAAAFAATMPLCAQTVQKVAVGESTGYGITYSLPQTLVAVTVEAECTAVKAGAYANYAERYLGVTDAAQTDGETWRLLGVTLTPMAEPDTARTYQIKFDKGNNPTCYLTDDGILWSINTSPTDAVCLPADEETIVSQPDGLQVTNSELLKAGSKAKQAEIAASQIFRIRESRLDLLTGEADNLPADGASYKLVLENLEAQENAYMALFTGEKTVRRVKRVFLFHPTTEEVRGEVLTRFSRSYGFVNNNDLSGEPLRVSMTITSDQRTPQAATDKKQKKGNQGVAFLKPGRASVQVTYKGGTVAADEFYMGQLGCVEQLPTTLFVDKKTQVKATFNPFTGAIHLYEQQ
jgi:hypothetical protein